MGELVYWSRRKKQSKLRMYCILLVPGAKLGCYNEHRHSDGGKINGRPENEGKNVGLQYKPDLFEI